MEVDERLRFLETRITSSLRPRNDDLKALFAGNENRNAFLEFCNNEDVRRLFVYTKEPKSTLVSSLEPPVNVRSKAVFFLKTSQATKLTKDNIRTDVVFADCETIVLKQLDLLAKEVYLPLLCTDGTQTYGKVSADKLMDILHRLMGTTEVTDGYTKGDITLPLPSIEVLAEAASLPTRQASVIHVLESSVIGWIKQIRLVLKHDPLNDLHTLYGPCPLPVDEVTLWRNRQDKLVSINKQLDSTVASDILVNLDEASSAYSQSFHNVRKEIAQALTETNDNLCFLETMLPWFDHLHSASVPEHLLTLFPPLLNTMMLVWSHSKYYHDPANFHSLLEVVSNEVVVRAKTFVGKNILKNTIQSYAGLKEALRVCAAYRGTYLDMKDKADAVNEDKVSEMAEVMNLNPPKGVLYTNKLYNTNQKKLSSRKSAEMWRQSSGRANITTIGDDEWEDSPWPARNAPCFNLMNSFMERCNDLLELVQTTRHFNLLQKTAEVGGAGTKGLDALVREIHQEFTSSMEMFGNVVEDILDVRDNHTFEKGFFHFRSVVKDLERRLATVLRQSFQQCPTIGAQLRLLEVFEGVSGREMVQEYLKDKDKQLINSFTDELIAVRSMFIAKMNSPPLHINLPPIVSCMTWVRALQRRIKEPMEKLKRISPHSLEGDAGWHLRDIYADTLKDFETFEENSIMEWQVQLYNDLRDRLKQPLLISDDFDEEMEGRPQILHVNLDPTLLLLLREVHYLSKEPFNVKLPDVVRELLRHADAATLRTTAARLATIVSKYNSAMKSMVDFEKPLFDRKLAKIDHLLDQGLNHYTWKMTESGDFIELASSLVGTDLHRTLAIVQSNCQDMVEITQSWSNTALDVFEARQPKDSYLMDDLLLWQRELNEDQERLVRPSGFKIHSLLQNSFQAVQISQASPAWEEYVDHIDALVLDGLKLSTLKSLRSMLNTLVHANVTEIQGAVTPILTIHLELIENQVTFTPPLDQSTAVTSVLENVTTWLEEFKTRGLLVKMLNPLTEGSYKDYITMDDEVINLCDQILSLVQENGEESKKLLEIFKGYTFLWLQDITETFDEFLHGRLTPNPLRLQGSSASARLRSAASERSVKSAHSGRASSASNYSISQRGAMGTAEKAFLRPQSAETSGSINVPSLDMFDSEIDIYRSARDEIAGIVDHRDIGWIRVDLKPIKQVLTTYASRWMWTFTKYLSDQVTALLQDLDQFLKRIEPEIESITGEERDTASFMKMMRIFNEVSAKQQEMDGQFTAMNRTVLLLSKYKQSLPDKTKHLYDGAPGRWNNLKTKVSLAKQRLGPRIQEESASITKDLQAFGKRVEDLKSELSESEVYTRESFIDEAFDVIKLFLEQLDQLDNEAQDLIELQELLETAVVNFTILPECRHELHNLNEVWETVQYIQEQQESWKQDSWQKQNTKYLKDATNQQLEKVNTLPEEASHWDVYMGLQESIFVIQACLPLIEDLSNPAMRTRHWKQLVRVTGGAMLTDNDSLQSMTLGQLLQLGLQNHADEVRSIVQRAIKDVTIEGALKTYEEIWLSKLFDMRSHARSLPGTGLEKGDKDDTDTKSEYSQSQSDMSISARDSSKRRVHSRMSSLTLGAGGRQRRASVSSLPASLLNLGEDSGQLFLLSETAPIFTELESHQVALQGMQSSSAAGSFLDEVTKWQKRLQTIEAVLTIWLEVQEKWVELEEVFSGNDIKNALSHEATLFSSSNRDFRLLMRATEKNPNVLQCCQRKGILTILEKMNNNLQICRKSLLQHLEKRRQRFPRFYFLSMEDVLHIVCNGYDLNQVNLYLPKLFENLGRLEFEEAQTEASDLHHEITGLISHMGEKFPLKQSVSCEGDIENWLANLLPIIKASLQQQLVSALGEELLQDALTPKRLKRERSIQSAGARRVTLNKEERKAPGSRNGSRANSRTGMQPGKRPSTRESQEGVAGATEVVSGGSWLLDHTSEVIHLAVQIQVTQQIEKGIKAMEGGDKGQTLKSLRDKISTSLWAAVVMLKGIEDKKEKEARLDKQKQSMEHTVAEKSVREGSVANSTDVSQTGRQSARSNLGSQWSLSEPAPIVTAPPIAEEGSIQSGMMEEVQLEGSINKGGDKPKAAVDTMKVVLPPERPKVTVVVEEEIDKTELQLMLFPGQMQKVSNLVALMAHHRDCVDSLLTQQEESKCVSVDSFDWQSHLKYIWNETNSELTVKLMDSDFIYGFEYLGSASRLIITPSSQKMFVSMMQNIESCKASLCVGSNPIGRAETLHELSRIVGQPLYFFNCSQNMDAIMLGDIFRGLASTGAWICLNNLNYIPAPALSIFSQLLQSYQEALRAKTTVMTFPLQGEEITLHANGACFATLDSQVRAPSMSTVDHVVWLESAVSRLPRDVADMFRVVAVINPDLKIALEVMLLSQGFAQSADVSRRLISLREMFTSLLPAAVQSTSECCQLGDYDESHGWTPHTLHLVVTEAGAILDELIVEHNTLEEEKNLMKQSKDSENNNNNQRQGEAEFLKKEDLMEEGATAENEEEEEIGDSEDIPSSFLQLEYKAIVTAVRNTYMPRLHGSDAEMFAGMVEDVFPDVGVPLMFGGKHDPTDTRKEKPELNVPLASIHPAAGHNAQVPVAGGSDTQALEDIEAAIAVASHQLGLLPAVAFQSRVAQLAQLMDTHQTVVVVGPPGCGKTESIKTVLSAHGEMGKLVKSYRVYTQSVESQELLGYPDPETREWKDGLFTTLLRKLSLVPSNGFIDGNPQMKVLHLDGEIDPYQMEVFSCVLQDPSSLTLANNERINMPDNLRLFWELESLASVAPSILSHTGLLSMDKSDVGWQLIVMNWLKTRPEEEQLVLEKLIERYVKKTLDYLDMCTSPAVMLSQNQQAKLPKMKRMVDVSDISMVMMFCHILESTIPQGVAIAESKYELLVNFAAIWAFAGTLEDTHRSAFNFWWRSEWEEHVQYPEIGEVFDYFVDGETQEFTHWKEAVPPYSMPPHEGIPLDAFVHTVSNGQISYLLSILSDAGKPVLLVGEAGCGKTAIVNDRIRSVCSGEVAEVLSLTVTSNRFTTSRVLWQRLEERLEWRHGRTFVPRGNKKLMCLVDDLNLAYVDPGGRQSACEMVRQHLDSGGVYEPDTYRLREIKNLTYVATVNPHTPASVPQLNPRLLRHFAVLGIPYPKSSEVHSIFTTLLNTHFLTPATTSSNSAKDNRRHFLNDKEEEKLGALISMIVSVTIEVQDRMRTMFLPTAQRCHYVFTLRDMRRMYRNICLSLKPGATLESLLMLWRHECEWIYGGRLVSPVDIERFNLTFVTAARKEFTSEELMPVLLTPESIELLGMDKNKVEAIIKSWLPHELKDKARLAETAVRNQETLHLIIDSSQPLFSNLVQQDSGIVTAGGYKTAVASTSSTVGEEDLTDQYQPCEAVDRIRDLVKDALDEYNKGQPKINISLYKETIQHVCRLARTIQSPHDVSHILIVAEGNPGLASLLARLAANLCGFNAYDLNSSPANASRQFKLDQFKTDLVAAYTKAGVRGEKIVFLLNEEELQDIDYLVYMEEYVVTGAISHLFTPEEQTTVINAIRTEVTAAGLTYTRETAWDFFLKTVRNNFRVILVSSSTGGDFQQRCNQYPSLTEHLNCFWFQHWTRENLVDHAMFHLRDVKTLTSIQKENLAHLLATMHLSIRQLDGEEAGCGRYNHLTNTTYEKFVERFLSMYKQRYERIFSEHATVTKALHHINKENKLAMKLQKQLEHELVVLEERKEGTIKLLSQIGQDTAIAEQQVKIVQKQLDHIQKLRDVLPRYALAHEKAVFKTVAIVQDTKKVVDEMDLNSLSELRGMQKPDVDTEDLMAAIIMILKSPSTDLTWKKGAKRQMANLERFMEELSSFDDHELPETTLNLVEPYLKKASFQPQNLLRKTNSIAAASLCRWVRGVVRYHRLMISKVKPLHVRVEETTAEIGEAERKLSMLESKKKSLEERLLDLALSFEGATVDKNDQDELSIEMKKQLETANRFREILAVEYEHCQQICQSVNQREFAIFGAVAIASGFATYLGPYEHRFRKSVLTIHWPICLQERGIPLVMDAIDPMKGWIIEWAIATEAKSRPSTRGLLSVGSSPRKDEVKQEERGEVDQKEQAAARDEDGLMEEKDITEEKPAVPMEPEEDVAKDEEEQEEVCDPEYENINTNAETMKDYAFSEAAETHHSYTVDNFPQVTSKEYEKYIQAMLKLLVGAETVTEWITKGLSIKQMENLSIQSSCWQRPPLLVDPNMEGVHLLRKYIQQSNLVNIDMSSRFDPSIVVRIEKAILSGRPLLLMNCEDDSFDNMVSPLIHHANHGSEIQGPEDARLIKYCGRRLLGHENFCVTMATTNNMPKLSSRIASSTVLVNYCSTPETLKEELLDRAFQRVLPHLYKERQKVMASLKELRSTIKTLDDKLLVVLEGEVGSNAITSHTVYVSSIVDNKQAVYARLQELEEIINTLDTIKDGLQAVAKRGAMLYSIGSSLRGIQREYHLSLPFFLWMFDQAVGEDPSHDIMGREEINHGEDSDDESIHRPSLSASTKISRVLREEDLQADQKNDDTQAEGRQYSDTINTQSSPTQEESAPKIDIQLPQVQEFPSEGVEYNSLSANHIKQLVDSLTQTVFQNVRQSLYEEHRLLFATMICLNIQYETLNIFSEEELSLLLQGSLSKTSGDRYWTYDLNCTHRNSSGNPGLGTMDLTLKDFESDATPPEFLPSEQWEDLMAVSVLPGPLDGICVQLAESPEPWAKWYQSEEPEMEAIPIRPTTSALAGLEEVEAKDRDLESGQSTPDLGDLTDFHQLVLLRLLRPDRFAIAASKYVARHLTVVKALPTSLGGLVASVHHQLGVLILMPPTPAYGNARLTSEITQISNPTDILREYAKRKSIPFQSVTLGEGCEAHVTMMIDAMTDKEGWLVIERLHLASEEFVASLKHQLIRGGNMGGSLGMVPINRGDQSRSCIWMTSEPSSTIPYFLIQNLRIVTWDVFAPDTTEEQEAEIDSFNPPSLNQTFKTAVITSLKSIPEAYLQTLQESASNVRAAVYAVCMIHGLLVSRQMFGPVGLTKIYALSHSQVHHGIDVILKSKFREQNRPSELHELGELLTKLVYSNIISDPWDQVFVRAISHHILMSACSPSGSIQLGAITLATPPTNVDIRDYPNWLAERWEDRDDSYDGHGFTREVKRALQSCSGLQFLRHLSNIYELQHSGPHSHILLQRKLNLTKVQNAVDAISEKLPPLLDLGELPLHIVNEAERYTFPYHAPSLMSLLSVTNNEMPQSIGFVLLQECHWLNSLLCHVRQSLHNLEVNILGGQEAMPEDVLMIAKALQEDAVPSLWVHPNRLPCGHSIVSWTLDLKKRYNQMRKWIKEGKVPGSSQDPRRPLDPHGHLSSLWLGGLVNPGACITALRLEKAVLEKCLLSEIGLVCEVPAEGSLTDAVSHEGGIYITDVFMNGASWDVEKGALTKAGDGFQLIPLLYIYPVLKNQRSISPLEGEEPRQDDKSSDGDNLPSGMEMYCCPFFINSYRQVCCFTVDLPCPHPASQWEIQRTSIILDPGLSEHGPRKWPKPAARTTEAKSPKVHQLRDSSSPLPVPPLEQTRDRGDQSDQPPPSRQSRRSALGVIHEGLTRDTPQQDSETPSRAGSAHSKSQGSKRSSSQQSKPPGQDLGVMDEVSDETGEEIKPDEFEAILTSRTLNLGKERHTTSLFDYRSPDKKESENKNQNASEEVEVNIREEEDIGKMKTEEDDAKSTGQSDSERYEDEGKEDSSADESYRSGSSHDKQDETEVTDEDDRTEDEDEIVSRGGSREEEVLLREEKEELFDNQNQNEVLKGDDIDQGVTITTVEKDDFFETASRKSAESNTSRTSQGKVPNPERRSNKSRSSAGSRKSSDNVEVPEKQTSPYGSNERVRSKSKEMMVTDKEENDVQSLKKQESFHSTMSGTSEKDKARREQGNLGSLKKDAVERKGSQTSLQSDQGIKRAGSGGSRSSKHSVREEGVDRSNMRGGSAASRRSSKKSVSALSNREDAIMDNYEEDKDQRTTEEVDNDFIDQREGNKFTEEDEEKTARQPKNDSSETVGEERLIESPTSDDGNRVGNSDAKEAIRTDGDQKDDDNNDDDDNDDDDDDDDDHDDDDDDDNDDDDDDNNDDDGDDDEEVTEQEHQAGEERKHFEDEYGNGDKDQGQDKEEDIEGDHGEEKNIPLEKEAKEEDVIEDEGSKNNEKDVTAVEDIEDGSNTDVAKPLLERMLDNADDENGKQEAENARASSPGDDSIDKKSIFDKDAPAY